MKSYVKKKWFSDVYVPSREMKGMCVVSEGIYQRATADPIKFWEEIAKNINWFKPWDKVYDENLPFFKWFVNGKTNLSYNCLDRHLTMKGEKDAIIFVPEDFEEPEVRITYKELYERVNQLANFLKRQGVKKGDVVSIYLPLIPEAIISMLACVRIGAIHSVVFSAFSSDALKIRLIDGGAKLLITADGYYRRGKAEMLRDKVKEAIKGTKVKKMLVVQKIEKKRLAGRFIDWERVERESKEFRAVEMDSEDPAFILYTSGTTGKPKGIVHITGGYAVQAMYTTKAVFNALDNDVMWCTADIGWITGHTYACYGPLLNGITSVIYEGSLDFPDLTRSWHIIEKNNVDIFYTAPTAIRMLKTRGDEDLKDFKLESLRVLGSVGEPIDESTWKWYFENVGKSRCPIVDTWWQTETGGIMISSLAGVGPFIPAFAARALPGINAEVMNEKGEKAKNEEGYVVLTSPLPPGALRGIWKDPEKYKEKYWSQGNYYFAGDGAFKKNGFIRITGRIDDVMKVAGHRMSTGEIEDAIHDVLETSENAVASKPDEIKGELPVVFARLKIGIQPSEEIKDKIMKRVVKKIGPIARPAEIYFVPDLPKTRSGKIMRRVLKAILRNEPVGEISTLVNPECVEKIKDAVISSKNSFAKPQVNALRATPLGS